MCGSRSGVCGSPQILLNNCGVGNSQGKIEQARLVKFQVSVTPRDPLPWSPGCHRAEDFCRTSGFEGTTGLHGIQRATGLFPHPLQCPVEIQLPAHSFLRRKSLRWGASSATQTSCGPVPGWFEGRHMRRVRNEGMGQKVLSQACFSAQRWLLLPHTRCRGAGYCRLPASGPLTPHLLPKGQSHAPQEEQQTAKGLSGNTQDVWSGGAVGSDPGLEPPPYTVIDPPK